MDATGEMPEYGYELLFTVQNAGCMDYPVNPKYGEIGTFTSYRWPDALPEKTEMVLIMMVPHNTWNRMDQVIDSGPAGSVWAVRPWTEQAVKICQAGGRARALKNVYRVRALRKTGKNGDVEGSDAYL